MMYTMNEINEMHQSEFVRTIGTVFEDSPWVAELSWKHHPFDSLEQLHFNMTHEMIEANTSLQLSLLRAHPDLGTKLAVSEASRQEQQGVGLAALSKDEYLEFSTLNKKYVTNFGFPFIMAVKGQSKDKILVQMKKRQFNSYESEMETALYEVSKIAKFRLTDMIINKKTGKMGS
ncbi:2-oxo-4-hydroxy-4-carboxy-5-ureidoimidazoline decarboxylase [Salipaludibacillus sp. HK11]|uniref:2-oxo-4-hydroxy-4-carboxy-5-ureidoimidazoline decarboxylase n=1 Tax=Salipaludibacillus sp. HK11 TaxID=3394320 RepID=UPI0039FC826D